MQDTLTAFGPLLQTETSTDLNSLIMGDREQVPQVPNAPAIEPAEPVPAAAAAPAQEVSLLDCIVAKFAWIVAN